jgi:hypothetical protein
MNGRSKDMVFSFYTSTDATGAPVAISASWDGVVWNCDNADPTYGRFDVTSLIPSAQTRNTIQSFRIDHGADANLELYEVRAAGARYVPPPPKGMIFFVR